MVKRAWVTYNHGVYILENAYYKDAFGWEEAECMSSFTTRLDKEDMIMELIFEENDDEVTASLHVMILVKQPSI